MDSHQTPELAKTALPPKKLLIVDDHEIVLKVLQRVFTRNFKEVLTSTTYHDGKAIIETQLEPGDAVLSDYHLDKDGRTGLELAEITAALRKKAAIKFIIMSGGAPGTKDEELIKKAVRSGLIAEYLTKPFDNQSVIEIIARKEEQSS